MQVRISPAMGQITISTSNGSLDSMKVKVSGRHLSYRTIFYTILFLAFLLPFLFILTALITLEEVGNCSSLNCLGSRLGPRLLTKGDASPRMVRDIYKVLLQVSNEPLPEGLSVPDSYRDFVADMKTNRYDVKIFAFKMKAMNSRHLQTTYYSLYPQSNGVAERKNRSLIETTRCLLKDRSVPIFLWAEVVNTAAYLLNISPTSSLDGITPEEPWTSHKPDVQQLEQKIRSAKLQEYLYRHFASCGIPKGLHCLSLRLADEYSSNAHARRQLPSPELVPCLTDNSYHHVIVATDNVLAASVVVSSAVRNSVKPEKMVIHVVTDKKTYTAMHAWFALHPLPAASIEVKSIHQFDWLTKDNVPVLEALETRLGVQRYYHGDHGIETDHNETLKIINSKLQAHSPKYISIMNHLRIYLPELFPSLQKAVFLDDDIVVQHDLSPLWDIDLQGKVNGAVETCRGNDPWVMSKSFKNYFNFSHPLIAENFDPRQCAWAYGMNIFDLDAWRKINITETYHYWLKKNLKSNLTLWRLGTLPPALIAFNGHVHVIDPSWHLLGLGYQSKIDLNDVRKAAVIHYNGQAKPWLDMAFPKLRSFWTKYVDYSNEFIKKCDIM